MLFYARACNQRDLPTKARKVTTREIIVTSKLCLFVAERAFY